MAYEEALAKRLRNALAGIKGVSEKKMMGGLCVLVDGNMLAGLDRAKDGRDRFMFRVGKEREVAALRRAGASIVELGGRRMGGFVFVDAEACKGTALKSWLALAFDYIAELPAK
jgi:hypothetical protein